MAVASESTGMTIGLDRVGISFPLDIELENLTATLENDTLLHTAAVIVDLDFSNILRHQVGIEAIDIRKGVFNSKELIPQMKITGHLGKLHIGREDTDLKNGLAILSGASISECILDISMRDTTIIDTTESTPLPWTIRVGQVDISNSRVSFRTVGDTLSVTTGINSARISGGDVNLGENVYSVESMTVNIDSLLLSMTDTAGTRSGIPIPGTVFCLKGTRIDCAGVTLPSFRIHTGTEEEQRSFISGNIHLDFNAFTPGAGANMAANIKASLSHTDILGIAGAFLPEDLDKFYPAQPLNTEISVQGNIDSIAVDTVHLSMPTVADIAANGYIADFDNNDYRRGQLVWNIKTMNLDFVRRYAGLSGIRIPGMTLSADTRIRGNSYQADAILRRGKGSVHAKGGIDLGNMAYGAKLSVRDMDMHDFMPGDSIGNLTLSASLKGHGTDPYSKATGLKGEINLKHLRYKTLDIDNARLAALLKRGRATIELTCDNDIIMTNACAGINIGRKATEADFSLAVNRINFHALGIGRDSLVASMMFSLDGQTDMKQVYRLDGSIHSMELATRDTVYYPLDIDIELKTSEDSILARANAGDMRLQFLADEGVDSLAYKLGAVAKELEKQVNARLLNQERLKGMLPHMDASLRCGTNNPMANFLRSMLGMTLNGMAFNIGTTPEDGVTGHGYINKLNTSAVILDSISYDIRQRPEGLGMTTRVKNGPRNKVVNFEATLKALITSNGLETSFLFIDGNGRKGVDIGVNIETSDSATQVRLTPLNPVLAYRNFSVNANNYISINNTNHIQADMNLLADDGTSLRLYSTPNEAAEQDVTLSVANFNLGELSSVMPFMPMITGMLNGDVHAVKDTEQTTVSAEVNVSRMGYEGSPLGDIGLEMVYFPNADGSHLVDGILYQNHRDVALLSGKYHTENEEGQLDAELQLQRLPLNIANGFITAGMARLEGYITGTMNVHGPISAPGISGSLATDSMHICSDPYSIDLRLPDDTITIKNNYLDIDKIKAYANGNNPLTLDGYIDFTDLSQAKLNISVVARDFNLINAPKRKGAEAYGKVYVDLFGRMQGTLNDLSIRGRLNVNGRTNVTYVMKDSPLVVDDQLSSLVTFTDFADTTDTAPARIPEQNVKMDIQVHIDEATTIHCLMSEDGQDKIDIEGGGELRMTYDMLSGMRLFGRYTILSGRMDYSLVIVSLKNFRIDSGSYVEFSGDMMNPKLNLSASERKKASVTNNNVTRTVNFDVGLKITQSLSDLGLEFTLKAPEDLSVQNELSTMSAEERGRAAVAMLTTGMYLSPNGNGGSGSFDATNALNSFLNSQISNIAGKALSTIDIGFGIDNSTSATGATQTDYNFSFAKRFWGNRISVIIGGKVSSGNDARNTGMSIIDNVSLEYRLDNSGTRYVKAFYNKDTESLLDAEVMEMGASLVLRRKTENLGELFIFRDTKKQKQARQYQNAAKQNTLPPRQGTAGRQ